MTTEIKEIYKCDFCNKLYQIKRFAMQHEKICFKNPKNDRPCFGCIFLGKKNVDVYEYEYDGSDFKRVYSLFFCKKKEVFLHTPKNEIKENVIDIGEYNLPMPKECEYYIKIKLNEFYFDSL